ncbi:TetR/AcrR family transcriptional regulator [Chitinimonas sp.]|uniref:TetR/AcrR family transcriptional regulator n=1 Tax=Chitinimonas sp. TaxID=1934313 RepID=UPI0035B36838
MSVRQFEDTREHLLATGEHIMLGKGFAAVGLAEILGAAQVPKGSFYHYFDSKEGFGVALLERFFANYLASLDQLIADHSLSGRAKLDRYFDGWQASACTESRCLVVKLTGEVSDLSEAMRLALDSGIKGIIERLTAFIVIGRADGSIAGCDKGAAELAQSLYQVWLGAALVAKVRRNTDAFAAAWISTGQILQH